MWLKLIECYLLGFALGSQEGKDCIPGSISISPVCCVKDLVKGWDAVADAVKH